MSWTKSDLQVLHGAFEDGFGATWSDVRIKLTKAVAAHAPLFSRHSQRRTADREALRLLRGAATLQAEASNLVRRDNIADRDLFVEVLRLRNALLGASIRRPRVRRAWSDRVALVHALVELFGALDRPLPRRGLSAASLLLLDHDFPRSRSLAQTLRREGDAMAKAVARATRADK